MLPALAAAIARPVYAHEGNHVHAPDTRILTSESKNKQLSKVSEGQELSINPCQALPTDLFGWSEKPEQEVRFSNIIPLWFPHNLLLHCHVAQKPVLII